MGRWLRRTIASATSLSVAVAPIASQANPLGGQVTAGGATIQGQGTNQVTINQSTQSAIINWKTFNIGTGETTRINMPNASSVELDRITGGLGPSQIFGSLYSNGKVFLVNPDGILFGPSSVVNTGSFLATTHNITDSDFMAGKFNFTIPGNPAASIVNQGTITAATGGFAALVAPSVRNDGVITAKLGTVALASGNAFTLDPYGDSLIKLQPGDAIAGQVIDVATGQPLTSLVQNTGALKANGGQVQLSAVAARQVIDSVINSSGVIEANTIGTHAGKVIFSAATAATKPAGAPTQTVKVSGKISVSGKKKSTVGGLVQITGENIQVANATINASGQAGGGTILIGGDYHGGNPDALMAQYGLTLEQWSVPTATTVSVDQSSILNASAITSGNGGKVVVWSNEATTFYGTILAKGGALAGDGGSVEVSSAGQLISNGLVNVQAGRKGRNGIALFDPDFAEIVASLPSCALANPTTCASTTSYITSGSLTGGGTVQADLEIDVLSAVISSGTLGLTAPTIDIDAPISSTTLSLNAGVVNLNAAISGTNLNWAQTSTFTLQSDNPNVNFTNWNISGNAVLVAGSTVPSSVTANNIALNLGAVQNLTLNAQNAVTISSAVDVGANGNLSITSGGPLSLTGITLNLGNNAAATLATASSFSGLNIGALGSNSTLSLAAGTIMSGIIAPSAQRDPTSKVSLYAGASGGIVVGAPASSANISVDSSLFGLPNLSVASTGSVTFPTGISINIPSNSSLSFASAGSMSLSGVSQLNLAADASFALETGGIFSNLNIGSLGAHSVLQISAGNSVVGITNTSDARADSSFVTIGLADDPFVLPSYSQITGNFGLSLLYNQTSLDNPSLTLTVNQPLSLPGLVLYSAGNIAISAPISADLLQVQAQNNLTINSNLQRLDTNQAMNFSLGGKSVGIGGSVYIGAEPNTNQSTTGINYTPGSDIVQLIGNQEGSETYSGSITSQAGSTIAAETVNIFGGNVQLAGQVRYGWGLTISGTNGVSATGGLTMVAETPPNSGIAAQALQIGSDTTVTLGPLVFPSTNLGTQMYSIIDAETGITFTSPFAISNPFFATTGGPVYFGGNVALQNNATLSVAGGSLSGNDIIIVGDPICCIGLAQQTGSGSTASANIFGNAALANERNPWQSMNFNQSLVGALTTSQLAAQGILIGSIVSTPAPPPDGSPPSSPQSSISGLSGVPIAGNGVGQNPAVVTGQQFQSNLPAWAFVDAGDAAAQVFMPSYSDAFLFANLAKMAVDLQAPLGNADSAAIMGVLAGSGVEVLVVNAAVTVARTSLIGCELGPYGCLGGAFAGMVLVVWSGQYAIVVTKQMFDPNNALPTTNTPP